MAGGVVGDGGSSGSFPARCAPPCAATFGSSLWLPGAATCGTGTISKLQLQLPSNGPPFAVPAVPAERKPELSASTDCAHLIAPSRQASCEAQPAFKLAASICKKQDGTGVAGSQACSPRITAVRIGTAHEQEEGIYGFTIGGLFSRLLQLTGADYSNGNDGVEASAQEAETAAAASRDGFPSAAGNALGASELAEVVVQGSVDSSREGANGTGDGGNSSGLVQANIERSSPAHLVAPAAQTWQSSLPAESAEPSAAVASAELLQTLSSCAGGRGKARQVLNASQQLEAEGPQLQLSMSQQQQQQQQQEKGQPHQQKGKAELQEEQGEKDYAQQSGMMAPNHEQQQPEQQQLQLQEAQPWQEGIQQHANATARRTRAHPIFDPQETQDVEVQQSPAWQQWQEQEARSAAASSPGPSLGSGSERHALAEPLLIPCRGQPVQFPDATGSSAVQAASSVSASPAHRHKAWSANCSHIDLTFDTAADGAGHSPDNQVSSRLHSRAAAVPQPGTIAGPFSGLHSLLPPGLLPTAAAPIVEQPRAECRFEHAVGAQAVGQYAVMLERFDQIPISKKLKRAVRASFKQQPRTAGHVAAEPAPSLLKRLAAHVGARGLRRKLERQRVRLLCLGRMPYCPDELLHFELWQAVCQGFTGMDAAAVPTAQQRAGGGLAPWEELGFCAANPAVDLGDTGVLCPLLLLLLLDRVPQVAAQLLAASQGRLAVPELPPQEQQHGGGPNFPRQQQHLPGFSLAEVAVEATMWLQRLLVCGSLAGEARRLESYYRAAETFWLTAIESFLLSWEETVEAMAGDGALGARLRHDPRFLLLTVLHQAEQRAWSRSKDSAFKRRIFAAP